MVAFHIIFEAVKAPPKVDGAAASQTARQLVERLPRSASKQIKFTQL